MFSGKRISRFIVYSLCLRLILVRKVIKTSVSVYGSFHFLISLKVKMRVNFYFWHFSVIWHFYSVLGASGVSVEGFTAVVHGCNTDYAKSQLITLRGKTHDDERSGWTSWGWNGGSLRGEKGRVVDMLKGRLLRCVQGGSKYTQVRTFLYSHGSSISFIISSQEERA